MFCMSLKGYAYAAGIIESWPPFKIESSDSDEDSARSCGLQRWKVFLQSSWHMTIQASAVGLQMRKESLTEVVGLMQNILTG